MVGREELAGCPVLALPAWGGQRRWFVFLTSVNLDSNIDWCFSASRKSTAINSLSRIACNLTTIELTAVLIRFGNCTGLWEITSW